MKKIKRKMKQLFKNNWKKRPINFSKKLNKLKM